MTTSARLSEWFSEVEGDFIIREQVEKFLATERSDHPGELAAFADQLLVTFVSNTARQRLNSARSKARVSAFTDKVKAMAEGERGLFETSYVVADDNTRRRLGDMTAHDHRYVARSYQDDSRRSSALAALHLAVARKLAAGQVTADVFGEDAYSELMRQVAKPRPVEAPAA